MISIYTVLMCAVLTLAFYALEYLHSLRATEWGAYVASGESNSFYKKANHYHSTSSVRALWLARLFLITTIALAVIEQCSWVADPL